MLVGNKFFDETIAKIKANYDISKLKEIAFKTSIVAWDRRLSSTRIDEWLENFKGKALGDEEAEKKLALWMLINFVYYTDNDVRALCRAVFEDYIHLKLLEYKNNNILHDRSISEQISHIIGNTIFVALGNDSESGSNILYYFRQENNLSKKSFEIESKLYENLVFIDDVTISGSQASKYMKSRNINRTNTYLLTFIATHDAIDFFEKKEPSLIPIYSILLDERSKCFSQDSYVFSEPDSNNIIEMAKTMSIYYGEIILKGHSYMSGYPLGFDNGQQMFGFFYNTPDNTIPIFWCDINNWVPAFKRYEKVYGEYEVKLNESFYV